AALLRHYDGLLSHYGSHVGLRVARKHVGWYCDGLPGAKAFRARVYRMDHAPDVVREIEKFYLPQTNSVAA
ncbi:MAG: tRNA dihydrouridine synthase DusB, partial [Rhodospirillaceae bacterium]|nr:tRNA dihydrouridine synthase DusB [Rhodospirillaceae bacterium]